MGGTRTTSDVVSDLVARVKAVDDSFNATAQSDRIKIKTGDTTGITFNEGGMGSIAINLASTLDSSGKAVTKQTGSYTIQQRDNKYSSYTAFKFPSDFTVGESLTINGNVYTATAATTGANQFAVGTSLSASLANLNTAIDATDTVLALGDRVQTLAIGVTTEDDNTLYIQTVNNDTNDVVFSGLTNTPTYGTDGSFSTTTVGVSTTAGMVFSAGGVISTVAAKDIEIKGYTNGAENMTNAAGEGKRIAFDLSGMTQFGSEFSPDFINQNGSKFGTFSGVTIGNDGLVTALFDNGETRKIFKIPMATFVNPNQLEGKSGNVWSATQFSGNYTLREADNGPSGQVVQSALEASTVDIGTEFTSMIVVQRAYSASTKIISTADAMLEELMRVKR